MLTVEQKKKYISSGGVHCPYCGSDELNSGFFNIASESWQKIKCEKCGEWWHDIYTLTGIEETGNETETHA